LPGSEADFSRFKICWPSPPPLRGKRDRKKGDLAFGLAAQFWGSKASSRQKSLILGFELKVRCVFRS
jgi:hypothetical protein